MVIHELRDGLRSLDADIVFLQEVQGVNERHALRFAHWPSSPQHEFLAEGEWQHAYGRNAVYDHGHHGNAILSRFPIRTVANRDVSSHRFEHRGLLHCEIEIPDSDRPVQAVCVHLSLHERGRRRQLETLSEHLSSHVTPSDPLIVAGDFNDWRHAASRSLSASLGLQEVSIESSGRPARTFPSVLPLLRLDRIYVRGFGVGAARAHRGKPWSLLSDHIALSADIALPQRA
ncbi:MAG: endonuclease/exonuclease/phosphatase family protein [Betaproteobacteria bacterium]|nr:endonuclease/exonuclease/phosphatase family protein [Betaproteobacteria bacterium]